MREETLVKKLKEFFSQMLPPPSVLGKVVRVYESEGKAHFLNSVYSADVELLELDESGNFKDSGVIVPDVPILSTGVGNQRGIFFLPERGSMVKVSFLYGSWDYPVIDGVLPYGKEIPQRKEKEAVIKAPEIREECEKLYLKANSSSNLDTPIFTITGDVIVQGNLFVSGNISSVGQTTAQGGLKTSPEGQTIFVDELITKYNTHTHTDSRGSSTSVPDKQLP